MTTGIRISSSKIQAFVSPEAGARITAMHLGLNSSVSEESLIWKPLNQVTCPKKDAWHHGGIPILFPFAGNSFYANEKGCYRIENKTYHMPIHGLVHNSIWRVLDSSSSFVELYFKSNACTQKSFPWRFELKVRWELKEMELIFTLTAKNLGCLGGFLDPRMPMAAGLHPYFSRSIFDYGQASSAVFHDIDSHGRRGGQVKSSRSWDLSDPSFQNSLIHKFRSNSYAVSLVGEVQESSQGEAVSSSSHFERQGFSSLLNKVAAAIAGDRLTKAFILWSDASNKFYCLEPWMGFPDAFQNGVGLERVKLDHELAWNVRFKLGLGA